MSKGLNVEDEIVGCDVTDAEENGAGVVEIILFSDSLSIQRHFVIGSKNFLKVIMLFRHILGRALKTVLQTFFFFGAILGLFVGNILEVVVPNVLVDR